MGKFWIVLLSMLVLGLPFAAAQDDGVLFSQFATDAEATSEFGDTSWSALQATGAPNVTQCGDNGFAWASADSTEEATLTVTFAVPVLAQEVVIYQSYNPGAIVEVALLEDGDEVETFTVEEVDGDECPVGISVDVSGVDALVDGVAITVDQSITDNWSEIDAVELIGFVGVGTEVEVFAVEAEASSEYGEDGYSAMQATGAPNVEGCIDSPNAWASAEGTEEAELTVYFPMALIPSRIDIYQSLTPGAITQVDFILPDGELVEVEDSADPGTDCPGVFSLEIDAEGTAVVGAVIYLDQSITEYWNEIDAVGLVGEVAGEAGGGGSEDVEIEGELAYGDEVEGEFDGEAVFYTFEGEEGDEVTIALIAEDFDPLVQLLDAEGFELATDDDSGGNFNALIEGFELPADGTYVIVVTSFSGSGEGDFELSLDD